MLLLFSGRIYKDKHAKRETSEFPLESKKRIMGVFGRGFPGSAPPK